MKYQLISQVTGDIIHPFAIFDKEAIKAKIIEYLKDNKTDCIEYCKDFEIISFYEINPKNNLPSLVILKGNKQFYKSLS